MLNLRGSLLILVMVVISLANNQANADYPPINRGQFVPEVIAKPILDPNYVMNLARDYAIEDGFVLEGKISDEVIYVYTRKYWTVNFNSSKSDLYHELYDLTVYVDDIENPRMAIEKIKSYNQSLKGDAEDCAP